MTDLTFLSEKTSTDDGSFDWVNLIFDVIDASQKPDTPIREGTRLDQLKILGAGSGAPIPRLFGRMRLGGQLIWHGRLQEHILQTGGDGDKGGTSNPTPIKRNYRYTMNFAIGLCSTPISHIGRIWADGQLINQGEIITHLHKGTHDQAVDPIIEAETGSGKTPAYRGLAYVTFQNFDLTRFGNRIPQLSFEIFAPMQQQKDITKAVNILPGATEFGYHPEPHIQILQLGQARSENLNASPTRSDWDVSIDALQESHPKCKKVALVVTWFGDDLRAGHCKLKPSVENNLKNTAPSQWSVAGIKRHQARIISQVNNRPAFGGTPSDESVIAAIKDLKQRGFDVLFYPFIMMDIPHNNQRPNPYGGNKQPTYPWRGRITCHPAPGQTRSPDNTSSVNNQINHFVNGNSDNDLFCLRGMVKHYADLCHKAGGIDAFLIASELIGLSRIRNANNSYPFANHLVEIANSVRQKLPNTKISYAADWSEYGAYVPSDGVVNFPLDEFWASQNCDFIGIDAYFPLSDWRDHPNHLDTKTGTTEITDSDYLKNNVAGGEYYDWYYANNTDREKQKRSAITDSANEPWLYRAKDVKNWWQNRHYPRAANVKQSQPTQWVAQSKPIWFTEVGCPAVDKGSNQPNVFPDKASSEAKLPHYSNGQRDDHIQQAYLQALTSHYTNPQNNPTSSVYNAAMIPDDRLYFWAWDARPFPTFPYQTDIWTDGHNWHTGHWLNGRQAATPLNKLIDNLAKDYGLTTRTHNITGTLEGYALPRVMSARDAIEPITTGFALDIITGHNDLLVHGRRNLPIRQLNKSELIWKNGKIAMTITQPDHNALPNRLDLYYLDAEGDYATRVETARHNGPDRPIITISLPFVLSTYTARDMAKRLLHEIRQQEEKLTAIISPRHIDLEAGDIIRINDKLWRITRITYLNNIEIEAIRYHAGLYHTTTSSKTHVSPPAKTSIIPIPTLQIMDLPAGLTPTGSTPWADGIPLLATCSTPWVGSVQINHQTTRWTQNVSAPSIIGTTLTQLNAGPIGRWNHDVQLDVEIYCNTLESLTHIDVLAGGNMIAIKTNKGWEVIQFANARLIGNQRYRLSGLLRGLRGSDAVMDDQLAPGAQFVMLGASVQPLDMPLESLPDILSIHYGPPALPQNSYGWQKQSVSIQRTGLKCLSPVHVKRQINNNGNWTFQWIRRSRIGGDDFSASDIPLGEAYEAYQIKIIADNTQIFITQTKQPQWIYSSTLRTQHQTTHATAQKWHITIAQISATQGPGVPTHFTFKHTNQGGNL